MRSDEKILLPVLAFCLAVVFFGDGVSVFTPLPVDAEGFHAVFLRDRDQVLSAGHMAVFGSQLVEDAATEGGGDYEVYWSDQAEEEIKAEHRGVVAQMREAGTPQWCLSDSATGQSVVGTPPEDIDEALAVIRETRGAGR